MSVTSSRHPVRAKSHVLRLLGDELIGDDGLAIFELVKNGYDADASKVMSRIRGSNTGPERALRRAAWALGLRYRLNFRVGRVRPDLVFVGARLAVFVDGCFWHGCPQHSMRPKNHRDFWEQKLRRNRERDVENTLSLEAEGWRVLRLWEHEIELSPADCAQRIAAILGKVEES